MEILRLVWLQHYMLEQGQVQLRQSGNLPPGAQMIQSPYDIQARFSKKRQTRWVGYKVHVTETCDEDMPRLITNVETTMATTPDSEMTATIHKSLSDKDLLPHTHLVDAGYVGSEELVKSRQQHKIELLGPAKKDSTWQAKSNEGYAAACFAIDWEAQQAVCPQGHVSRVWRPRKNHRGNDAIEIRLPCTQPLYALFQPSTYAKYQTTSSTCCSTKCPSLSTNRGVQTTLCGSRRG